MIIKFDEVIYAPKFNLRKIRGWVKSPNNSTAIASAYYRHKTSSKCTLLGPTEISTW